MSPKSELAWKLDDYQKYEQEPPQRIIDDPTKCEGELMTQGEVDAYLKDCVGTMLIMLDHGSPKFAEVRDNIRADLDFLLQLGKIDQDEYNEIIESEEFSA
jgi:hypothetical protein